MEEAAQSVGGKGTSMSDGSLAWATPLLETHSPLISDAVAGDTEALSALLTYARPVVYQWALYKTQDPDDAEDVTQDVLLRVHKGISSFRGQSKLSSWLYRITANESVVLMRKESRRGQSMGLSALDWYGVVSDPSQNERIHNAQTCGLVRNVACALPPLQLAAFRLVDLDGLRPCEAAEVLGRTQTTVRSSLCRARKRIRELVQQARAELSEDHAQRAG